METISTTSDGRRGSARPGGPGAGDIDAPAGIKPEKWARLLGFLGGLPTAAATRLFAALELDRAIAQDTERRAAGTAARAAGAKTGLPHDALLAALREELFERDAPFPARQPTAQRLFFTPFEDFIIARRRGKKRRARIARASLQPIWKLLLEDPACADAAAAAREITQALAEGDQWTEKIEASAARLFKAAAKGLRAIVEHAETDEDFRSDLARRLSGETEVEGAAEREGALRDLAEIAFLLPAADHFKALQQAFHRPVANLTEADYYDIRKLYAAAFSEHPDIAPYLLLCLAGRLEAPWRALGVYYHLAGADDEALAGAREDSGVIVETLFDDLEGMARRLERQAEAPLDAEEAALRVGWFADFANGLTREAMRARDGVVVNRVEACRDVAAAPLGRFAEQATAQLRRATPVRHAGGSSRLAGLRPEIHQPIDPSTAQRAREAAAFIAKAPALAAQLERPSSVEGFFDDAALHLNQYIGDLIMEIRAGEGEDRRAARAMTEHAMRLAAPILPADELSLLGEKAQAAAHSA